MQSHFKCPSAEDEEALPQGTRPNDRCSQHADLSLQRAHGLKKYIRYMPALYIEQSNPNLAFCFLQSQLCVAMLSSHSYINLVDGWTDFGDFVYLRRPFSSGASKELANTIIPKSCKRKVRVI
eukprot:3713094-Amphidinium_carterae.1